MIIGASFPLDKLQIADLVAAKRIGFDFLEFNINNYLTDIEELELQLIAVRDVIDSYDLFSVVHLPHLDSRNIADTDFWTQYIDNMSERIELIGKLGIARDLVFHAVFGSTEDPKDISTETIEKHKNAAIKEWLDVATKYDMKLLLENTDESVKHLDKAFKEHPRLGFAFDIGHANILFPNCDFRHSDEKIYALYSNFKDRLEHIHLHDNFGGIHETNDKHLPIGIGNINFKKFVQQLIEDNYSKTSTLEIYNPLYQEDEYAQVYP
jgi:sugar phosphate isomerase/epimerase